MRGPKAKDVVPPKYPQMIQTIVTTTQREVAEETAVNIDSGTHNTKRESRARRGEDTAPDGYNAVNAHTDDEGTERRRGAGGERGERGEGEGGGCHGEVG